MNKVYFPIVIAVAVAVGVLLGSKLNPSTETAFLNRNSNKNKLNKLIDFIEKEYVDSLNTDSIVDLTVNGILEKLDPHSVYISKEEVAKILEKSPLSKYWSWEIDELFVLDGQHYRLPEVNPN